ncbi:histone-lysine N-methyltransferase ASHH1 isoform X2 [Argentina anserina]|uniref:histone-lysine N-methyltransferase ASHH1 isoform X2 n=1 Tax=Argentina anserina TaxID=57926 RepID=UPI0021764FAF|nr:histone-lysine N-methyltransferase ASHH1 isoform X2 [Potentilla anserina]
MKETERDAMLNMDPNDNEQKLLLPASSVGNMELGTVVCTTDQRYDQEPQYTHIDQNEFLHRRHKKQQEEDIVTCECKYEEKDLESACGERCLNVLTSTECTPGYCPCSVYCKNQRFQKSEYAKIKLFKTEGRGWGIQANQNIKAGQFIIEYCGEVISCKEAKKRSHAYELEGIRDAFIISLNASESIDATVKGSLARFINHSCLPNCETRKWNVLGEIRVGIFAKQDILVGTELSYDYNFEWYGGAKVRCLCGASSCSGFLGAKSRGFQEDTYLWEDDDERYSVEKIPLYDSAEDEPSSMLFKTVNSNSEFDVKGMMINVHADSENQLMSTALVVHSLESDPMECVVKEAKNEVSEETQIYSLDNQPAFLKKNAMISRIRSNTACRNYHIESGSISNKRIKQGSSAKLKHYVQKQVNAKSVALLLASNEAQEEILKHEEMRSDAAAHLESLYNEIRPAIEEHERDSQDSVATSVAEKWIEACCLKLKTELDLYSSIVKRVACTTRMASDQSKSADSMVENEIKLLPN